MPLNWTVQQFNDWVDVTFPDNQARLISEADLRDGFKNTVLRSDERAAAAEGQAALLNTNFVTRSLNLNATIYVDGLNGDDTRTGTTNNTVAGTGSVKTLARVVELHSGKTNRLSINIKNTVEVTTDLTLDIPFLEMVIDYGANLLFKKVAIAGGFEGGARLLCQCHDVLVRVLGNLTVEGYTLLGSSYEALAKHGAFSLRPALLGRVTSQRSSITIYQMAGAVTVGDNAVLAMPSFEGLNRVNLPNARYMRDVFGGTFTLGTNAVEHKFPGNGVNLRQYHPSSSTDVNVYEGETVLSPTNNKLWTKRGGTIRDAMGTTFA